MPRNKLADRIWTRSLLVGSGQRVVPLEPAGPCEDTRRDVENPRSWAGLAPRDRGLLESFLDEMKGTPDELHTNVGVGRVPVLEADVDTPRNRKMIASLWPRRIDAAMKFGRRWWLVECKPDANHYVVGQILCYVYWWARDCPACRLERVVLVTDVCDADVRPVLSVLGVEVVELGLGACVVDPVGSGL